MARRGLTLNNDARNLFLNFVLIEYLEAVKLLERRAKNDYTSDTRPVRFPKFNLTKATASSEATPWALFDGWVKASKRAPATVTRWRAVFLEMQKYFDGRTANSLTEDEVRDWLQKLITPKRSAVTVSDVWRISARTVFAWALQQRKISANPFSHVKITVPKKTLTRETKAFRPEEIQAILSAAFALGDKPQSAFGAACRWVPWLCAYTGARAGEITQLRGKDLEQHGSIYAIRITPEAGTVKTGAVRVVPLHWHVARPGANITGFTMVDFSLIGKLAELLKTIAPKIVRVALMFNPDAYPFYEVYLRTLQARTQRPVEVTRAAVRSQAEITEVIAALAAQADTGVAILPDGRFTVSNRAAIRAALE